MLFRSVVFKVNNPAPELQIEKPELPENGHESRTWQLGAGSRFTITLPQLTEESAPVPPAGEFAAPPALVSPTGKALRAMVVDDNEDAADMLAMFLEIHGHQVLTEDDPARVVERALAFKPHVCLLDIGLPGEITNAMHRAGVKLIAGTDTDSSGDDPYPVLDGELEKLVRYAGLTPQQAIIAATANAAQALGKLKEFGTLAPGKFANMVFLTRDPLQDIGNVRSVSMTVKRGHRYARADYTFTPLPAQKR